MERNPYHIFPSYFHLAVSFGSLVDWFGSFGSCKIQVRFNFNHDIKTTLSERGVLPHLHKWGGVAKEINISNI
jgi:hypothetical protein